MLITTITHEPILIKFSNKPKTKQAIPNHKEFLKFRSAIAKALGIPEQYLNDWDISKQAN